MEWCQSALRYQNNTAFVMVGVDSNRSCEPGNGTYESMYLVADIDVSILGQQQRHQVHTSFLCRQMDGADALPCYCVGVSTVLQQRGPNIHLVLFGSDVQWCVTILSKPKDKKD